MQQHYTSKLSLVRDKWLKHEIYDAHGDLACAATVKKTKGVNNTKIKDGAGAIQLTLKRGLLDRDICAHGPDGELKYRLVLPKVMTGSTRREIRTGRCIRKRSRRNYSCKRAPCEKFIAGTA